MHLTDEQITTKLIQVGLPQHGTREERIALLVRMGIIEGEKVPEKAKEPLKLDEKCANPEDAPKEAFGHSRIAETFEAQKLVNADKRAEVDALTDVTVGQATDEANARLAAPKRMGRPPKAQ